MEIKNKLNDYKKHLENNELTQNTITKYLKDVAQLQEFLNKNTTDAEYINILYATFVDRVADDAGRQTWTDCLAGGMTRTEVLQGFSQSEEFKGILTGFGL